MKRIFRYLPLVGVVMSLVGATSSCQNDFDGHIPAFEAPVADHQANMSILDLKRMYWREGTEDTDLNYCDTVGFKPNTDEEHIYISGRVISTDQDGNIFKCLVIQDASAALAISINQYDLYLQYRVGQEIVIDVTGMYLGKYRGLMQLGLPSYNEQRGYTETSFMPIEFFRMHSERNGFPEPSKIDSLAFANFDDFSSSSNPEVLMKYQSQLVRFNNVSFANANGTTTFSTYQSSGVDQPLVDSKGASTIPVRTSGYSSFWNNPLPKDHGDVVGILSYYGSNANNLTYQLLLNDLAGCMNFGNPTVEKGTSIDNPYSVDDVIEREVAGTTGSGWVTGYIVGAVKPEVEGQITGNNDIEWGANVDLANTIVISYAPEVKDVAACLVVPLAQGSALRQYGNLLDNPGVYGKQIWLYGSFDKYMGAWGITCPGTVNDFKIDGVQTGGNPGGNTGDGTEANPYSVAQAMALYDANKASDPVWVECYIVGSVPGKSYDETNFSTASASTTNIVVGGTAYAASTSDCMPVALPAGDVRTALNLSANPGNLGRRVALYGTIEKYFATAGIKNVTAYKWLDNGDPGTNPGGNTGTGTGTGTENDPWNVTKVIELYKAGTTGTNGWTKGYIVGTVPSQYLSDATFGTENASNTNVILAPSASETDINKCIVVQLPTNDVRTALSLQANPGNLGKCVLIHGDIDKYFGTAGIKNATEYKWADGTTPDKPDTPPANLGTQEQPISVSQFIAAFNAGSTGDTWVEGYIVGTVTGKSISDAVFGLDNASNTNFLLAPSRGETDVTKCIPVQLPQGDIRTALSLQVNPNAFGMHILLNGNMAAYFTVAGLKETKYYSFYNN